MRFLRSIAIGLGIAILATSVVLGSLSLAMLEGTLPEISSASPLPSETMAIPVVETVMVAITDTIIPSTITATWPPTPSACPAPAGWAPITIQANENLEILSKRHNINIDQII